jgi:hypothetical protein
LRKRNYIINSALKLPLTFVDREVIPYFHALVAFKLKDEGMTENRIASLLGVTQPAVNLYLKRPKSFYYERLKLLGLTMWQVESGVRRLTNAYKTGHEGLNEAVSYFLELLGSGILCEKHKNLSGLPTECEICMKLFGYGRKEDRESLLDEVNKALRLLERSESLPSLLPEVRSNLVARLDRALTEEDVVGIPGRIVEIHGRAKALRRPEFGASRHMAKVLLEVSKVVPNVKAAINLKYDAEVKRCIEELKWICLRAEITEEDMKAEDPVINAVRRTLSKAKGPIDCIFYDAFYGLEASIYIFAENPLVLAEKALKLASKYRALIS